MADASIIPIITQLAIDFHLRKIKFLLFKHKKHTMYGICLDFRIST